MIASSTSSQTYWTAVLSEDVVVCVDFNIRIDRAEDLHTRSLIGVFSDHGFIQCVDRTTHEKGGILDVGCSTLGISGASDQRVRKRPLRSSADGLDVVVGATPARL